MVGRVLDFKRAFCGSPHTTLTLYTVPLYTRALTVTGARCKNSYSQRAARARVPPANKIDINVVARYKGGLTRARQPSPADENHSASTS